MQQQIDGQKILDAIREQRDESNNIVAQQRAYIRQLEEQMQQLQQKLAEMEANQGQSSEAAQEQGESEA